MAITPTGTQVNRTNYPLPNEVSNEIIQKTQENSAVMQLARQISLPGRGIEIPVILSDPNAEWVSETGMKPVSRPTLDKKIMTGYKLAVIVPFSNEFRRDEASLYNALVGRLPGVLAAKFDETVFHGTAPGSNFDTLAACTAQSIATGTEYSGLVAADGDIADHDGVNNGFVISPKGKNALLLATDGDHRPLFINSVAEGAIPMILGVRTLQSKGAYKAGSPNVVGFAGDWTKAVYGIVEGITVGYSEDATLTVGESETINLFQQNMFAVRVEMEVGFRADTTVFNKLTV
jgi:HK97 family phage major capsid protein